MVRFPRIYCDGPSNVPIGSGDQKLEYHTDYCLPRHLPDRLEHYRMLLLLPLALLLVCP